MAHAFLLGKIDLTKIERGQTAKLICALEQKTPFEGTAIARLIGLPDGVAAKPVEITKESRQAEFEIATTDKSPTGTFKNVFCNIVITQSEESISHNIATGSVVRIDAPRAKKVIAAPTPAVASVKPKE